MRISADNPYPVAPLYPTHHQPSISEFESSPYSKLDLMWIFSSDLQLVGVLIVEYNLSNDRIRNSD